MCFSEFLGLIRPLASPLHTSYTVTSQSNFDHKQEQQTMVVACSHQITRQIIPPESKSIYTTTSQCHKSVLAHEERASPLEMGSREVSIVLSF